MSQGPAPTMAPGVAPCQHAKVSVTHKCTHSHTRVSHTLHHTHAAADSQP